MKTGKKKGCRQMPLIDDYMNLYAKNMDYYREAGRVCAQICETNLEQMGIRTIVTSRAKRQDRLRDKLEKRSITRKYSSVEEIEADIADLAGVRIALYFPGDLYKVRKFIEANFVIKESRVFPEDAPAEELMSGNYKKRFSGYWATHCRVYLTDKNLTEETAKYAGTLIEIQIASALMHAWAEVEHDLIYKPYSGDLSYEEYQILDELNGLVLTGEIALQRLQKAVKNRVSQAGKEFNNHYEVAMYLNNKLGALSEGMPSELVLGRVDLMFQCIKSTQFNKPEKLKELLISIDTEDRSRPVVEQIMDRINDLSPELYKKYKAVKQSEELKYQMETLQLNRESGNRQGEANTLANIGYLYSSKERYDEAMEHFTQALQINREIGGRQGEANQLLNLGSTYRLMGELVKALEFCKQALQLHIKISYKQGQANTLGMIGNIHADGENYEQAHQYYNEALKIYRSTSYKIGEIVQLNNIGMLHYKQKDMELALRYFNQSLTICKAYEYRQGESDALHHIGNILLFWGNLEEAVNYYEQALAIQAAGKNQKSRISTLICLGRVYESKGENSKAYPYFREALAISRNMDAGNSEAEALEHISRMQKDDQVF
jgi:ppGpp synthetase/RelA/SpoT-type nucleotidyltranferase/uncharacterized protein HemY